MLVVVSFAGLSAEQTPQSLSLRNPIVPAGKWELATGQHSVRFDGKLSILELKVEGAKLTGTITTGHGELRIVVDEFLDAGETLLSTLSRPTT